MPARSLLVAAVSGLVKRVVGRVTLHLPDGQKLVAPAEGVSDVLTNVLHVYCHDDYTFVGAAVPREGWVVVDAGAYVGAFTLWSGKLVSPGGMIVSLEPNPESYRYLRLNAEVNGLSRVRTLKLALCGRRGKRRMYVPPSALNASLVPSYAASYGPITKAIRVFCVTLEDLLKLLSIKRVDLLKLDVEGLEHEVLLGSRDVIARRVRRLVIEVHTGVNDASELANLLEGWGFDVYMKTDHEAPLQEYLVAVRD